MHWFGTILGALMGFAAAWMPEVIGMLNAHFNHGRDLEVKKQQIDAAKQGYEFAVQPLDATAEQYQLNLLDAQEARNHIVLEFLRSSVRPLLTYGFFALFAIVKLVALLHGLHTDHVPVATLLPVLWDEDTESLFAAVISFWFGSRAVTSAYSQRTNNTRVVDSLKGHNNGIAVLGE